jgi:acyl dehydratase
MNLDDYFQVGVTLTLGSHRFEADAIKAFAQKFDPQPFHLDEEAARNSVFGRLCASGWHTAATWMKYNLKARADAGPPSWDGPGPAPVFGPSPGLRDLKWLKPVYAGETVTFTRTCTGHRPMASRPGWRLLSARAEGFDSTGDKVIQFDNAVLVQTEF